MKTMTVSRGAGEKSSQSVCRRFIPVADKVDQDVDSLFSPLSFNQAPTLSRGVGPFEEASNGLEKGCTFS